MWVRTQRGTLLNLNRFDEVQTDYESVIAIRYGNTNDAHTIIGRYDSVAEAVSVIDDMADFVADNAALPFNDREIVFDANRFVQG